MGKKNKTRADQALVARGLASSLELARAYVMAGRVVAGERRVDKPSEWVADEESLRVRGLGGYVGRGGNKLAAAVEDLGIADVFKGARVLDAGASTGGFTDASLRLGASSVVALDVGTCQLAWELRSDPRVTVQENTDLRVAADLALGSFDLVLADLSFISLARLTPDLIRAADNKGARFLVLVKPQFELDRAMVPAGGVVVDDALRQLALERVVQSFGQCGLTRWRAVDARVHGRAGNREIFLYVEPQAEPCGETR